MRKRFIKLIVYERVEGKTIRRTYRVNSMTWIPERSRGYWVKVIADIDRKIEEVDLEELYKEKEGENERDNGKEPCGREKGSPQAGKERL